MDWLGRRFSWEEGHRETCTTPTRLVVAARIVFGIHPCEGEKDGGDGGRVAAVVESFMFEL